jgi:hypothetical protein
MQMLLRLICRIVSGSRAGTGQPASTNSKVWGVVGIWTYRADKEQQQTTQVKPQWPMANVRSKSGVRTRNDDGVARLFLRRNGTSL